MKCNNRNKLVTIGDIFDFTVFKGNVFVFSKQQKSNLKLHSMHYLMKLYRSQEIEFTKVMQSGQVSAQDISNYTREHYDGSLLVKTTVGILKDKIM